MGLEESVRIFLGEGAGQSFGGAAIFRIKSPFSSRLIPNTSSSRKSRILPEAARIISFRILSMFYKFSSSESSRSVLPEKEKSACQADFLNYSSSLISSISCFISSISLTCALMISSASFLTLGSDICARSLVNIAMEWWGIIPSI